jgi:hypothetical protein
LTIDKLYFHRVGTWLSLVEHRVRDAGVAGSNPVVPTKEINKLHDECVKKYIEFLVNVLPARPCFFSITYQSLIHPQIATCHLTTEETLPPGKAYAFFCEKISTSSFQRIGWPPDKPDPDRFPLEQFRAHRGGDYETTTQEAHQKRATRSPYIA